MLDSERKRLHGPSGNALTTKTERNAARAERDSLQARLDELLGAVELHRKDRKQAGEQRTRFDRRLYAVAQKVREGK